MDNYYDYLIEEITTIITDNLKLFNINDHKLIELKEYSLGSDLEYPISNEKIIYFTRKALIDLITTDFLYDFRDIE
ncbi:MAG: hypothetical protein IJ501_05640 [Bacilli bacterium]|nr:hypothetical protein [Bacilli bacterium]